MRLSDFFIIITHKGALYNAKFLFDDFLQIYALPHVVRTHRWGMYLYSSAKTRNNGLPVLCVIGHAPAHSSELWKDKLEIAFVFHRNVALYGTHPSLFYLALLYVCQGKACSDIVQRQLCGKLLYIIFIYHRVVLKLIEITMLFTLGNDQSGLGNAKVNIICGKCVCLG